MIRQWLGRLALRAYPDELLESTGPEILDTMLEMAAGSTLALARELAVVVFCGLRERSRAIAADGRRQLVADGCRLALILVLVVPMWGLVSGLGPTRPLIQTLGVLAVVVAFLLLLAGYNRWVGIGGLLAIAMGVTTTMLQGHPGLENILSPVVTMAVPALCCAVLAIAPGRRAPKFTRLWWFAPLVVIGIVLPPDGPLARLPFELSYQDAFLAVASAIGILRLSYDPRLALGCGLVWATYAARIAYSHIVFGFTATPDTAVLWSSALILTASGIRLALMRQKRFT